VSVEPAPSAAQPAAQEAPGRRHGLGRRRARRLLTWAAAAGALALLLGGWRLLEGAGAEAGQWRSVRTGELVFEVEIAGALEAVEADFVGPPAVPRLWSFQIERLAPEGERVERGDVVLAFDASQLQRSLQDMQASHQQAVKELEKREIDFELRRNQESLALAEAEGRLRVAELGAEVPEELMASIELARSRLDRGLTVREVDYRRQRLQAIAAQERAELASLRHQRDRAAARVEELQQAIVAMQVRAPRSGPVIYVADWRGEKGKVGDTVWRGRHVLQIPDLDAMRGKGEADEADAGRIAVGQPVRLRLDAFPDEELTGFVESVETTVQRRSPTDPMKVVAQGISLDQADPERFRPGMRFRGAVEVERLGPRLLVPVEAVFPDALGALVYRRGPLGTEAVRPVLGRRDGRHFEVLEGLAEGDLVSTRELGGGR
jgi:HlyD family secretion protein